MNEMRSDSEYSLPSVEHYEGGVSGMAGVGAGRGRSNTLVVGLDQKRRSRSASRAPTPTIMMSAPVEEEWKATPRDTRRRSRSVTKIIQRDAVQAEQVLASLAPAPFAGRQRSASVSRATDNASLPPHLQSSSTNEFSLAPEPVTRQRARSVSRPNFETPSPIANASAGPSVLSLNEQPTRPRTRSRSKSHCPPPAGGKVPMPLTPDRFQRGGGSTGVSPVGTPNFASAASSPGRPSTPVRTQASDVPTRRRADTVSARASALSILEGPSPTRQREQRLQNPRLGELSDSTLPIRHQSQGFPSLRHQASSSSLNDNQAVPRRPPRSARRQSILPPLRTGRDTPENSPVLKSPLATQTPIIMHVDVEETIASEAETYNAAAGETETEDDRLMTAPAPAPAPAPRVDEPLMTESEDLEWEMMTTGPADDTTAAIETWRRLAESFEKGNPDEEIKVLSDGEGPGYTIVKNYQAQQRPQSTTVHVANHIHAANEPYPEVGASASASASPSRRILAEEALAAERRRVSKQFLLSESSPAKRTSVHERERERLSSPRSKRLSSMVSARPTLSTKSSPPFIPEKTSDSAPHDYDFPTSKAARSPRSPRCFQPYVWAGSRSSVAESESEAGPSTPVPGAFPSMADQALDALDQPLPLLLSGGSAAAARSSGSGSKTDVCQQAGMALSSFGTGLGLYFPDEEGSGRRLDQAHAEPHPAAAAPLETWTTQLDSHDSISVGASDSDASSRTGSECYESADEGDEGDWNSRRGSRASMAWFDAAEAFERQHGCARGSAGWRTSVRFSLDRRMSFVSPEADRKRLSVLGHQRESRAMQMPAFDEVAEYTALAEEEVVVEPREEERMVEPPCTNEVEEDEAQTPVLSRPASQSTVEDTTLLTPRLETHDFDLALPLPNRSPGSPGEHEVEMFEKEEVKLELGDVGGGADSDPEQHRLSTFGGAIRKREPSRRWSALPTERASAVFEADNSTLGADGGGRRSSRRISRSGTTGGRVRGSRTSAQARKRLTAMVATTPLLLVEPPSHSSWRSTLAVEKYEQLLEQWGPKEMHRQEVIWELCETERSFVQALCSIQRVFALPLRTPEGRWINGVPCSVARLFDWLEDILQFHSKVSSALQRARAQQQPLVVQIADSILKYIPRLEVHQPYLVRFETVTATIEEMLRTSDSVFGQFLKMQMLLPECGSMSFSSFLLKPVQRLMKYPLFFKVSSVLASEQITRFLWIERN